MKKNLEHKRKMEKESPNRMEKGLEQKKIKPKTIESKIEAQSPIAIETQSWLQDQEQTQTKIHKLEIMINP